MQQPKANRHERRYLERIAARVDRAMAKGKPYALESHIGVGIRNSYRLVRQGRVIEEYGYEHPDHQSWARRLR